MSHHEHLEKRARKPVVILTNTKVLGLSKPPFTWPRAVLGSKKTTSNKITVTNYNLKVTVTVGDLLLVTF